jgi:hypothetical protein
MLWGEGLGKDGVGAMCFDLVGPSRCCSLQAGSDQAHQHWSSRGVVWVDTEASTAAGTRWG